MSFKPIDSNLKADIIYRVENHPVNFIISVKIVIRLASKNRTYQTILNAKCNSLDTSRLDYCNNLLYGAWIDCSVQTMVAGIITRSSWLDHISPVLKDLHWLPVAEELSMKYWFTLSKHNTDKPQSFCVICLKCTNQGKIWDQKVKQQHLNFKDLEMLWRETGLYNVLRQNYGTLYHQV
jgi:hypothetical protein